MMFRKSSAVKLSNHQTSSDVASLERRGYRFGKKIGKGTYGSVVAAHYDRGSGDASVVLACKYINKGKAPKDFIEKFLPRELELLTLVNHPNIIRVHSIMQSGQTVFIFMKMAENGNLLDYIKNQGPLPERQARLWFYQLVSAIQYLHSLNFAHRDLKCENVLISEKLNLKLADFGFARSCIDENDKRILSETYCGSAAYAAPEIVCGTAYDPKKSDVWSLGVILFIMLNATMPFDDTNMGRLLKHQKERRYQLRDDVKESLSCEVKILLPALLEPKPSDRLSIEQVLKTKWLQKYSEK